jgi:outer membrane lipoprotein-sorting protein
MVPPRAGGPGSTAWKRGRERAGGQDLLRFDSIILSREKLPDATGERAGITKLTRPGFRYSVWADPRTLRLMKVETEYYDGQKHTRTVSTNYEYDVALPPAEFAEKVP